jgi:hypothetical protein
MDANETRILKQINFVACRAVVRGGGSIRVHSRLPKNVDDLGTGQLFN